ncbi:MAG: anti-FecI sigma factor FecR [Puniceicoccaceae bacterium 5H]|nr:MAG: anti-FecI sigma factor FecR [Puniceicoccaceae bacterium 5H]
MKDAELAALVAKRFSGEASSEEISQLNALLSIPENRAQYEWLQERWRQMDALPPEGHFDSHAGLEKLRNRTDTSATHRRKLVPFILVPWRRVAQLAAVAVLGIGSYFIYTRAQPSSATDTAWREVHLQKGYRALSLADGTRVTLNAGSTLSYPQQFESGVRRVELDGEAFFEVVSDAAHPFIVQTDDLDVVVTGTVFNVRNYDDEGRAEVSLLEGKVEVKSHAEGAAVSTYLKPEQQLKLEKTAGQASIGSFESTEILAWKDGDFVFRNTPLSQVARELSRFYGIDVSVDDPDLARRRITGKFGQDDIWVILEALTYSANAQYEVERDADDVTAIHLVR